MNKKTILLLGLIIVLAFFLRFYRVTEVPPALNWDEVSIGYNAYSVLKTGRDEWGKFLPIHFKAYGEYKLPAQIYASIPGIALFGLNELGVRITPVIYGTLTVMAVFFLSLALFRSSWVGMGAAFLLAISPWHIHLTRASFESSFAVFWVVLGIWFLVKGFEDKKWFILSMIPFAVSVYTYNTARVFTPLFLIFLLLLFRKTFFKLPRIVLASLVVFLILMIPLLPYYLSGEGNARYKLVSITDDPGLVLRINENRGNSSLPDPLPRLAHNKATYIFYYVAGNYLAHFTPDFLFFSGAPHKQHHVQGMGELYLFQAPFLLLGLYFLFKTQNKFRWLLISWLLLAFVPVSMTQDSIPHALRTLVSVPVYQLLSALGLYEVFLLVGKRKTLQTATAFVTVIVIVVSVAFYLNNYYKNYAVNYSRDWQYGYKQAVAYINEHQNEYDQLVFSRRYGDPHMFTLFYLNYPPSSYQNNPNLVRYETNDWVWVLNFDKYYFPDLSDEGTSFKDIVNKNPGKRQLYIGKPEDFPSDYPRLKSISFLNAAPAFDIVEVR